MSRPTPRSPRSPRPATTGSHAVAPGGPRGSSVSSAVGDLPRAVRVLDAWEPVVVEGPKEHRAASIAGHQNGRAAHWQLLAGGVSDRAIRTMREHGDLISRLPGVYAVGHAAPSEFARETEALLCFSMPAVLASVGGARVGAAAAAARGAGRCARARRHRRAPSGRPFAPPSVSTARMCGFIVACRSRVPPVPASMSRRWCPTISLSGCSMRRSSARWCGSRRSGT